MTRKELMAILDKQKMYEVDERGRLIEYSKDSTNPSRIYIDLFNLVMDLGDTTIEPERPKGEWIVNGTLINCSVCKHSTWSRHAFEGIVRSFNFCPNCGADMRGLE